uniref:Uncharacterized protein n=1 Tax=Lepeophtheirus salmonis TaxID=72036 RepID=A0A0K2TPL6_LEPSM
MFDITDGIFDYCCIQNNPFSVLCIKIYFFNLKKMINL